MAAFFSLGGGGGAEETNRQEYHHHHQENTSTHNWFLYKNHDQELPTYKGFELWQQQQQQQSHNNDEQNYQILRNPIINPFGLDIGPSHDHQHHHHGPNMMMRSSSITISCQDCGNQAKKDCQHMRCRTCCKSRGFQCQTHVKSTWVPAAKRRERQQQLASLQQQQEDNNKPKRQKDDTITGLEVATNFPSKLNSIAMFQRVRMSSIEQNEDQIAYQAVVNINGHIFKGILYDQGDNHEYNYMNGGDSSSGGDPVPRQHNLNITGTTTSAANDATADGDDGGGGDSATIAGRSQFLETSLYSSAPLINTYMAGTQFFPPPRS